MIKFKQFNIEYYEDPIADLTLSLLQRLKKHDINIAIDESLYNGDDYKLWIKNYNYLKIFVSSRILLNDNFELNFRIIFKN